MTAVTTQQISDVHATLVEEIGHGIDPAKVRKAMETAGFVWIDDPARKPAPKPEGYPDTTELDRLVAVSDESQRLGEFLDWLEEQGYHICTYTEPSVDEEEFFYPIGTNFEKLLAQHYGIDLDKVERERRAVLEYIRDKQS